MSFRLTSHLSFSGECTFITFSLLEYLPSMELKFIKSNFFVIVDQYMVFQPFSSFFWFYAIACKLIFSMYASKEFSSSSLTIVGIPREFWTKRVVYVNL